VNRAMPSRAAARRRPDNGARGLGGGRVILRPVLPYLTPVPGAAIAVTLGVISTAALAAIAASAALCALVRALIESARIELRRDRADGWIIAHAVGQPTDDVVLARMRELTDARTRTGLATSILLFADAPEMAGWNLLRPDRRRTRAQQRELRQLAHELGDLSRRVMPRGVALSRRLVTAAGSPLHDPRRADELSAAVRDTIAALDGAGRP
jgi:hypothetical protein